MNTEPFSLTTHSSLPSGLLVRLAGVLDLPHAEPLFEAITSRLAGGAKLLLVDGTAVEYLNSTVLGLLAAIGEKAQQAGGGFAMFGFETELAKIIDRCGFPFLNRFDDAASAETFLKHIRAN